MAAGRSKSRSSDETIHQVRHHFLRLQTQPSQSINRCHANVIHPCPEVSESEQVIHGRLRHGTPAEPGHEPLAPSTPATDGIPACGRGLQHTRVHRGRRVVAVPFPQSGHARPKPNPLQSVPASHSTRLGDRPSLPVSGPNNDTSQISMGIAEPRSQGISGTWPQENFTRSGRR